MEHLLTLLIILIGVLKQENVPAAGLNLVVSPIQTTNYELTYVADLKRMYFRFNRK